MRIHAILIVGLFSIQIFTIHAAGISDTPRLGDVSSSSSKTSTTALQGHLEYMQGLMEQIQSLIKEINVVMNDRPQPPNTSEMSKENAEKIKKHHAKAIEHWQKKLVRLQNKLAVLQKKLAAAERKLNTLKNSYLRTQTKKTQTQQMGLEQRRINRGVKKSVTVSRRILNIQAQSKKQQKEVTQTLKSVRTLLR